MIQKRLSTLLSGIKLIEQHGPFDPLIAGLAYDSRKVDNNYLFFALEGLHVDGHIFITPAVEQGAKAIIHSKPFSELGRKGESGPGASGTTYIRVSDPRRAVSPVSAAFYDYPSRSLCTIGVTGTDGKSTTVFLIYRLLELHGRRAGFLSTVQYKTGDTVEKNELRQSTPEANEVQALLRQMVDRHKQYAVIEATSHGLSERNNRLGDVDFNVAVFTNITHEHLEFHGTFEQYRYDKSLLFRRLKPKNRTAENGELGGGTLSASGCGSAAIVNKDDPNADYFLQAAAAPVFTYSVSDVNADMYATEIDLHPNGSRFLLHYDRQAVAVELPLPGMFNVENCLAAALAVTKTISLDIEELPPLIARLGPPPGRMNTVDEGQPFTVIIDYAHTPGSFSKILPSIKENCAGRLITVFGSAGERDKEKRSIQGGLAEKYSDIVILTDEDPRGEPGMDILLHIAEGCTKLTADEELFLIPDREKAITHALSLAKPKDTIVLLGKGHESSILYKDGAIPWNERETARRVLRRLGYGVNRDRPRNT